MSWLDKKKNLPQPKPASEGREGILAEEVKAENMFLVTITKPLQGATPFLFNSKRLWNRKESRAMWFSVSGTEHSWSVKQRMAGAVLGGREAPGNAQSEHSMCWAGIFCQSRVQKTKPNLWKASSLWDITALTAWAGVGARAPFFFMQAPRHSVASVSLS